MNTLYIHHREVYQFISPVVYTNMYAMFDDGEGMIVDPHDDPDLFHLLDNKEINNLVIMLTHEHPDHTWGVKYLSDTYPVTLICHEACAKAIADKKNNRPITMLLVLSEQDKINGTDTMRNFKKNFPVYECRADIVFARTLSWFWHDDVFELTATPGHSPGSCCVAWNKSAIFTGDSLLPLSPVITRFPGGSQTDYETITKPYLDALPLDSLILPGHGDVFKKTE